MKEFLALLKLSFCQRRPYEPRSRTYIAWALHPYLVRRWEDWLLEVSIHCIALMRDLLSQSFSERRLICLYIIPHLLFQLLVHLEATEAKPVVSTVPPLVKT